MDSQDNFFNGATTAIATTILFFFIWKGVSYVLSNYLIEDFDGFSLKLMCIAAVVANAIPMYFFNKYERGLAMRGLGSATMLIVLGIAFYFWDSFLR
ncbi:MAG: hypothetical protein ACPGVB_09905 [Chitinophagales bacterium]